MTGPEGLQLDADDARDEAQQAGDAERDTTHRRNAVTMGS
jgi:hypothetical protein